MRKDPSWEMPVFHLPPAISGENGRYSNCPEDALPSPGDQELLDRGYQFEQLLLSYIEQGKPELIREVLCAPPAMLVGKLADNHLRQTKNAGICGAAIASRAAIAGGVDHCTAFRMSDYYIQKIEACQQIHALEPLLGGMLISFADKVRQVRYHTMDGGAEDDRTIFQSCAEYVSQNIYAPIRVEELAETLGYSRSYLCNCFKRQTGMTLSQYCQQEKILEAQRFLRFTDQSLSEIAALFAFSSQSHFQTVFKRVTGETPLAYRRRMR